MIEPAFADGDGVLALDPVAQLREVFRTMFGEEHRMQAVGGEQPVRAGTDVAQLRPASGVDRGHDLARDPRGPGPRDHFVAIAVELACVEVAMAVDQHVVSPGGRTGPRWFRRALAAPASSWPAAACRARTAARRRRESCTARGNRRRTAPRAAGTDLDSQAGRTSAARGGGGGGG